MILWHDGSWLDDAKASRPIADRGGLLGDGLFETMRVRGGQLVRGGAHAARLMRSCQSLGLRCPVDEPGLENLAAELVQRNGMRDAAIRLTVSAGTGARGLPRAEDAMTIMTLVAHKPALPPKSVSLQTSKIKRSPSSPATAHKTLSYIDNISARREAKTAGADMALMLDTAGNLSGSDCANLFWYIGDQIFTPALGCGVLAGTVREGILAGMSVSEGCFHPRDLQQANTMFLTNALIGIVPVDRLDGSKVACDPARIEQVRRLVGFTEPASQD